MVFYILTHSLDGCWEFLMPLSLRLSLGFDVRCWMWQFITLFMLTGQQLVILFHRNLWIISTVKNCIIYWPPGVYPALGMLNYCYTFVAEWLLDWEKEQIALFLHIIMFLNICDKILCSSDNYSVHFLRTSAVVIMWVVWIPLKATELYGTRRNPCLSKSTK